MEFVVLLSFVPKTRDCAANYKKFVRIYKKEASTEAEAIFCENLDFYFNYTILECPHCEITSVFDRKIDLLAGGLQPTAGKARALDCQQIYCAVSDRFYPIDELPTQIDHRVLGLTTLSKDYKNCGSCWSFGEAAVIENAILLDQLHISSKTFKKNAKELHISENYLLRNTYGFYKYCTGGNAQNALQYAFYQKWPTFEIDQNYPYDNGKSEYLWKDQKFPEIKIPAEDWYFPLKAFDDYTVTVNLLAPGSGIDKIMQYLARGIAVLATMNTDVSSTSGRIISSYSGNWPLYHFACNGAMNHYVVFIGYGKFKGEDVWLVKNSWGTDFGSKGSMYVLRGQNSWCIEYYAYAVVPLHYDEAAGAFAGQFTSAFSGIKRGLYGFDKDDGTYTNIDHYNRNKYLYILAGCVGGIIVIALIIWISCKCHKKRAGRQNAQRGNNTVFAPASTTAQAPNPVVAETFGRRGRKL